VKAAEWAELVRRFLPADEEWGFSGFLAYRRPVGRVLFGVELGKLSDPDSVRVYHVIEPLFYPRIRGQIESSHEISISKDHIFDDYEDPLLRRIHSKPSVNPISTFSPRDEVGLGLAISHMMKSTRTEAAYLSWLQTGTAYEPAAYAQLLMGDPSTAVTTLTRVLEKSDEEKVRERSLLVRSLIESEGAEAAIAQLDRWVDVSAANYRLRRE
jgi:hypothetical protein